MAVTGARVIPRWTIVGLVIVAIVGLVVFQLLRPLPAVAATTSVAASTQVPGTAPTMPWPAKGEAAVGTAELGLLGVSPAEDPLPMASTAKLMTALVVLEDKPLAVNDAGPPITIDATDVADYQARLAAGESTCKVVAGEQLSEFDALQCLLVPSGNNIAAVLAKWDAGSVAAMVTKLNARAATLGLKHTHFNDPAGIDPGTSSNPRDMFHMAVEAMKSPVLAKIAGEVQADLPVAGIQPNVDSVLGQDGIIGIKTGSGIGTATGSLPLSNFVFASRQTSGTQSFVIYGAVMGQDTLADAFSATKALIDAVKPSVAEQSFVGNGDAVGSYQAPWGSRTDIHAGRAVTYLTWPGMKLTRTITLEAVTAPVGAGRVVGRMELVLAEQKISVSLSTGSALPVPGPGWRLTRIR